MKTEMKLKDVKNTLMAYFVMVLNTDEKRFWEEKKYCESHFNNVEEVANWLIDTKKINIENFN